MGVGIEGERFGEYLLLRRLAVGGMGELFLSQRAGIAGFYKQLVVKRIRPELARDTQFIEMFLHEGRVAALIDHPNVVHIYDQGQVEGTYFMSMEYVPGKDLAAVLAHRRGPLDLPVAMYVMNSVCEGVAFAHDAVAPDGTPLSLVHRDLNPRNVLLGYAGVVKIADFGIAKVRRQRYEQTRAGVLKGAFGYLSPEQAVGVPVDRRSDVFTLGLLLFEMTTGETAYSGRTDAELLYAAGRGLVRRPSQVVAGYPARLERIYLTATSKRPEDRYQTVNALLEDLLAFQMEERVVVTPSRLAAWMQETFFAEWSEERRAGGSVSHPRASVDASPADGLGDRSGPLAGAPRDVLGADTLPDPQAGVPLRRSLPERELDGVFAEENPALAVGNRPGTVVVAEADLPRFLEANTAPPPRPGAGSDGLKTRTMGPGRQLAPRESVDLGDHPSSSVRTLEVASVVDAPPADDAVPAISGRTPPQGEMPPEQNGRAGGASSGGGVTADVAGPANGSHRGNGSSLLSSTMRLFVDGGEDTGSSPMVRDTGSACVVDAEVTSRAARAPKRSGSTLLGWAIIALAAMSGGYYFLGQRARLFFPGRGSERRLAAQPKADQRPEAGARPAGGAIVLVSEPPGADFFHFAGQTPATVQGLDSGRPHLLRLEHEGYEAAYQIIEPEALAADGLELRVRLRPTGSTGGAQRSENVAFPMMAGPVTGRATSMRVLSDPPAASAWLLVGRGGRMEMTGVDTGKSYSIEVVLAGRKPVLVGVTPVDFNHLAGVYRATVRLDELDDQGGREPDARTAVEPGGPEPTGDAQPKAALEPRHRNRPAHARSHPPSVKAPRARSTTTSEHAARKGPSKNIRLPGWAE
jgi:serine/threonine protein kinase